MNQNCELIKDLLPLYQDGICSEESKRTVEEHLKECNDCKQVYEKLKNTTYEDSLQKERTAILKNHAKVEKKRTFLIGSYIAGILMIPVIICLICNLAIGHALDWFFIVAASLLVLASITVVPLMVPEKKGLYTITGFTASLLLLLLVCCIYTSGNWFFVAAVSILLGLSVVFLPYLLYELPLGKPLKNQKGLLCMTVDTLLLFATILTVGLYSYVDGYWYNALLTTAVGVVYPWVLFLIIRYLKINGWYKAGICFIFSGIYTAFINDILHFILEGQCTFFYKLFNLSIWNRSSIINANVYLIELLCGIGIGCVLFVIGSTAHKSKQ